MSPFETPLRTATLVVVAAGLLAPPGPVHSDVGDGDRALRSFERAASAPPLRAQPVDPVVWERRQRPPDRLGPTPVRPADLAMLAALRAGRWAEASRQLKAGAAVNAHDEAGSHPLALAAAAGQDELVGNMIRLGAVLDRVGEDGFTPLGAAAWRGHRSTARLLLRAGADPAAWGYNGHPPLHLAALAGHADLVEEFLRLGSPIELLNRARETALDVAASANQDGAMDLLIRGGADMTKAGRR
jgi:hypothetical protein